MAKRYSLTYSIIAIVMMCIITTGTIVQYHHHDENDDVCLCHNPLKHCHNHDHDDCNHKDEPNCHLHLEDIILKDNWQHNHLVAYALEPSAPITLTATVTHLYQYRHNTSVSIVTSDAADISQKRAPPVFLDNIY